MGCCVVWQTGSFGKSANDPPQHMGVQRPAVIIEEQLGDGGFSGRFGQQDRANLGHVFAEVSGSSLPQGNDAVTAPFALENTHGSIFEVHVVDGEPDQFQPPQSAGVEQFQHGAVAVAQRRGEVWLCEQAQHLFVAQHAFGHDLRGAQNGEPCPRIDQDFFPLVQEPEEPFDDPHLRTPVANAYFPALRFSVALQVLMVVNEVLKRDVANLLFRAGLAGSKPTKKQPEHGNLMPDG